MRYFKLALEHLLSKEVEKELKDSVSKLVWVDVQPEPNKTKEADNEIETVDLATERNLVDERPAIYSRSQIESVSEASELKSQNNTHFVPYKTEPDLLNKKRGLEIVNDFTLDECWFT